MAEFAKGRSMLYSSKERFDSYQYENEFGVASYFRVCDTYAHEIGHQPFYKFRQENYRQSKLWGK